MGSGGADVTAQAEPTVDERTRFEILPFGRGEPEAAELTEKVRLTVTCSPKHGPDRSVEVAARLRALGHRVTVHVAARMVRDRAHLDALLVALAGAGVDDVFLVGGDVKQPLGPYAAGGDVLRLLADHPHRPRSVGIPGYPEGHPLIGPDTLDRVLLEKARHADYVTTQLCFHPGALREWILVKRAAGMSIPVFAGVPGRVHPGRLLELSVKVGVGPSLSYLRKQHGIQHLVGRSAADNLYDALAPQLADPQLGLAGFHYFTFNQLLETWQWQHRKGAHAAGKRPAEAVDTAR